MNVKILYRSAVVWNSILFVLFSYIFLYFQNLYLTLGSIRDKSALISFVQSNIGIALLFTITIISLVRCLKIGRYFLLLCSIVTLIASIYNLNIEFSKFNVVILFVYLAISYYIYEFYIFDQKESYYNPLYHNSDLFKPMLKVIDVKLLKADTDIFSGVMTNWSPEGCFVVGDESKSLSGTLQANIVFDGVTFVQTGIIVSKAKALNAYGVRFIDNKGTHEKNSLGWKQFYEIIDEMGYKPEFLR